MGSLGHFICGGCGKPFLASFHAHPRAVRVCPHCRERQEYRFAARKAVRLANGSGKMEMFMVSLPADMALKTPESSV